MNTSAEQTHMSHARTIAENPAEPAPITARS